MKKLKKKMEIKNNLKLHAFFFHLASIFFQENPQLLFSPVGRSVCSSSAIHPVSERCMHIWVTYAGVHTALSGFTASKRCSQISVFHVNSFIIPERAYQGQKVFQPDLWLGFSYKINRCFRRTACEGLYHQYLTESTFLIIRIAYLKPSVLVLSLEVGI